jgi:hypothetical protein
LAIGLTTRDYVTKGSVLRKGGVWDIITGQSNPFAGRCCVERPLCSGRGAVRLARTVRVGEVGGSNPLAPTKNPLKKTLLTDNHSDKVVFFMLYFFQQSQFLPYQIINSGGIT